MSYIHGEIMNCSISRPRRVFGALFCASVVAIATAGCGGGGDDAAAPSTTTYPLATAYSNYLTAARTQSFTSSGTVQGVSFTATGTTTQTAPTNVTFEGKAAQTNTRTTNINAVAQGQTLPLTITAQQYFANGLVVGISAPGTYGVVTVSNALPASASIGATGTLYTTTIYASSAKLSTLGTTTVTYALEADGASNSAVLRLSLSGTGVSGSLDTRVRITTSGNASTLSEPVLISGTPATLTYQQ